MKQHRSAETGKYVSQAFAARNKATTYSAPRRPVKSLKQAIAKLDNIHHQLDGLRADCALLTASLIKMAAAEKKKQ